LLAIGDLHLDHNVLEAFYAQPGSNGLPLRGKLDEKDVFDLHPCPRFPRLSRTAWPKRSSRRVVKFVDPEYSEKAKPGRAIRDRREMSAIHFADFAAQA
jgi:hypothetical protein